MIRLDTGSAEELLQWFGTAPLAGPIDDIRSTVREQLNNPGHAGDLLETISTILTSTNSRGQLYGESLQMLRAAVLTPSELVKLRDDQHMSCLGCGKRLSTGAMVTYNRSIGGFMCATCMEPTLLPCTACKSNHEIGKGKIKRLLKRISDGCGCSRNGAAENTHRIDVNAGDHQEAVERGIQLDARGGEAFGRPTVLPTPAARHWTVNNQWNTVPTPPLTARGARALAEAVQQGRAAIGRFGGTQLGYDPAVTAQNMPTDITYTPVTAPQQYYFRNADGNVEEVITNLPPDNPPTAFGGLPTPPLAFMDEIAEVEEEWYDTDMPEDGA